MSLAVVYHRALFTVSLTIELFDLIGTLVFSLAVISLVGQVCPTLFLPCIVSRRSVPLL